MQRNYQRWDWGQPDVADWKCSECGTSATNAVHLDRDGVERRGPYNARQVTCSRKCADIRKLRLQDERRELARQLAKSPQAGRSR